MARLVYFRRGFFARFLRPGLETHERLFGKYRFVMNLSAGRLQRIFFLKPDCYEMETQEALRKLIKPGMTVLDIGANTGYFSLLMADLVGPSGSVYCFEPFPGNFELLKTNVQSNGLAQVHIFLLALSDRCGSAVLSVNPINDGGHSLGDLTHNPDLAGYDQDKLMENVQTETLDSFLHQQKIPRVDVVKIDVEGAETLVFAGAANLLSSPQSPALICEIGDSAQGQAGKTEKDLRRLLYSYGYKSYWLRDTFQEFGLEIPITELTNVLFKK